MCIDLIKEKKRNFTDLFVMYLYHLDSPDCDDMKVMYDRYLNDPEFNKRVKDLVECSMDIATKEG